MEKTFQCTGPFHSFYCVLYNWLGSGNVGKGRKPWLSSIRLRKYPAVLSLSSKSYQRRRRGRTLHEIVWKQHAIIKTVKKGEHSSRKSEKRPSQFQEYWNGRPYRWQRKYVRLSCVCILDRSFRYCLVKSNHFRASVERTIGLNWEKNPVYKLWMCW